MNKNFIHMCINRNKIMTIVYMKGSNITLLLR